MVLGCEMVFFRNNHNKKGTARKKGQEGERRKEEGRNPKEESGAKK